MRFDLRRRPYNTTCLQEQSPDNATLAGELSPISTQFLKASMQYELSFLQC